MVRGAREREREEREGEGSEAWWARRGVRRTLRDRLSGLKLVDMDRSW